MRASAAKNPNGPKVKIYTHLIDDPNEFVREIVAFNPNAVSLERFIELFDDPNENVRESVAANPNAVSLERFIELFDDPSDKVGYRLGRSPNVLKEYPKEHKALWKRTGDTIAGLLVNPESPYVYPERYKENFKPEFYYNITFNKNAWRVFPEEFKAIFDSDDERVLIKLASSPKYANQFPDQFVKLFECGYPEVFISLIENRASTHFREYRKLHKVEEKRVHRKLKNRGVFGQLIT